MGAAGSPPREWSTQLAPNTYSMAVLSVAGLFVASLLCVLARRLWLGRQRIRKAARWLRRVHLSERLRETYAIPVSGLELRIGLDIGGSLAKLVFLEKKGVKTPFLAFIVSRAGGTARPAPNYPSSRRAVAATRARAHVVRRPRCHARAATAQHRDPACRSVTLARCRWQNSSNTYGDSGVRDEALAVSLPELGGRMHFVRFETSHIANAMKLMQVSSPGAPSAGAPLTSALCRGVAVPRAAVAQPRVGRGAPASQVGTRRFRLGSRGCSDGP